MNPDKYLINPDTDLSELARCEDTGVGKAFIGVIEKRIEVVSSEIFKSPKRDNDNLKNDLTYKLGSVQALKDILQFLQDCKEQYRRLNS